MGVSRKWHFSTSGGSANLGGVSGDLSEHRESGITLLGITSLFMHKLTGLVSEHLLRFISFSMTDTSPKNAAKQLKIYPLSYILFSRKVGKSVTIFSVLSPLYRMFLHRTRRIYRTLFLGFNRFKMETIKHDGLHKKAQKYKSDQQ